MPLVQRVCLNCETEFSVKPHVVRNGNGRFCSKHCARTEKRRTPEERLTALYVPEPNSGCWLWTGSASKLGYGQFGYNGKSIRAYRASWMIHCGPIPDGLSVLHRCDNPPCVNPEHLFLGTNADNMADMVAKGRAAQQRGERNKNSRLSDEKVRAIRMDSRTARQTALDYGVSTVLIHKVRQGRLWGHVQ